MTQLITGSRDELDSKAVQIFESAIKNIAESKEHVVFAVPGGRSVSGIFRKMIDLVIPWSKLHFFMLDERLVPIDDKESNFVLLKQNLLDELTKKGKIPAENIHPFIMNENKEDFGTSSYAKELKKYGGKFDIILLSSGEDGHVGGLYPNHSSIKSEDDFFITYHDSPKPPPDRMSFTKNLLTGASTAVVLFYGEGKKEALLKFKDEKITFESCPCKLVNKIVNSFALTDIL